MTSSKLIRRYRTRAQARIIAVGLVEQRRLIAATHTLGSFCMSAGQLHSPWPVRLGRYLPLHKTGIWEVDTNTTRITVPIRRLIPRTVQYIDTNATCEYMLVLQVKVVTIWYNHIYLTSMMCFGVQRYMYFDVQRYFFPLYNQPV